MIPLRSIVNIDDGFGLRQSLPMIRHSSCKFFTAENRQGAFQHLYSWPLNNLKKKQGYRIG
jgi:hypothetical protein